MIAPPSLSKEYTLCFRDGPKAGDIGRFDSTQPFSLKRFSLHERGCFFLVTYERVYSFSETTYVMQVREWIAIPFNEQGEKYLKESPLWKKEEREVKLEFGETKIVLWKRI